MQHKAHKISFQGEKRNKKLLKEREREGERESKKKKKNSCELIDSNK